MKARIRKSSVSSERAAERPLAIILSSVVICIAHFSSGRLSAADEPATAPSVKKWPPIALHPYNPHYLFFRGKPTVLITSTEHYGAVLNLDFDYIKYLDELKSSGLNLTRTFSGTYHEVPSSFGIIDNTLAPAAERFIGPWPRSDTPGAGDGLAKFDLSKWNNAYFARLKDFVAEAGKRGIVVELVIYCTIYDDKLWSIHPFNPANNVQNIGPAGRLDVYTLKDKALTAIQEKFIQKVVSELRDADNLYFEICNEPYFGGITPEWNARMADVIAAAEPDATHRHLVAQNIANGSAVVKDPHKNVSILNFHYAVPPDAVAANVKLGRAIADDETGFKGKDDLAYRTEAWNFMLAGGAIYDNLDYSFSAKHPDGSFVVTTSPGGGGASLRKQLSILKQFVEGLDFTHMSPDSRSVAGGVPEKGSARVLAKPGEGYAVYIQGGKRTDLVLDLPAARYTVDWINTKTGKTDKSAQLDHPGGKAIFTSPEYSEDIALRILARK